VRHSSRLTEMPSPAINSSVPERRKQNTGCVTSLVFYRLGSLPVIQQHSIDDNSPHWLQLEIITHRLVISSSINYSEKQHGTWLSNPSTQ